MRWTGTKTISLDYETVCQQIHEKLTQYGINRLIGDQFCFPLLKQYFAKLGIFYREFSSGSGTRASLYGNLRQLLAQQKISLLDDPGLLSQLRRLEEVRGPSGNVDIRPAGSSKDDVAIAVALAAAELSEAVLERRDPVILGAPNVA
jgi:hypothetical protein